MIEITELTKRHRGRTVVDALTFTVPDGAVTGFVGPNGAGKTTTMRLAAGLARPDHGSAEIDGAPLAAHAHPARALGTVLDASRMPGVMSTRAHLAWLAAAARVPARRADETLEEVGLASVASRRVSALSLGMRQRLALASALLGEPGTLILDEPVNGLDPDGVRWIRTLVRELAGRGCAVLVSSHLMAEMQQTADRVIVIGAGRLLGELDVAHLGDASLEDEYLRLTAGAVEHHAQTRKADR